MNKEKKKQLIKDFATAINMASAENESNTPDFILAEYLVKSLDVFNKTTNRRSDWYCRTSKRREIKKEIRHFTSFLNEFNEFKDVDFNNYIMKYLPCFTKRLNP